MQSQTYAFFHKISEIFGYRRKTNFKYKTLFMNINT